MSFRIFFLWFMDIVKKGTPPLTQGGKWLLNVMSILEGEQKFWGERKNRFCCQDFPDGALGMCEMLSYGGGAAQEAPGRLQQVLPPQGQAALRGWTPWPHHTLHWRKPPPPPILGDEPFFTVKWNMSQWDFIDCYYLPFTFVKRADNWVRY